LILIIVNIGYSFIRQSDAEITIIENILGTY
jgi:hypothetical protein